MKTTTLAILLFFLSIGHATASPDTLRTVALSGGTAPGTSGGVNFAGLGNPSRAPVLNDSGQTAFYASLTGTGVNDANNVGIWSEGGGGELTLVARAGNAAPDSDGAYFLHFPLTPILNDSGQVAFFAGLTGTVENSGIWSGEGATGLALLVRRGDDAPGTDGGNFGGFRWSPAFNNAGQTAFRGFNSGPGVNTGIWSGERGAVLNLVVREEDAAPGTNGAVFSSFGYNLGYLAPTTPVLNDAGQTAFLAVLAGTDVNFRNDRGIWSEGGDNGLALVAREGGTAPGAGGAVFSDDSFRTRPQNFLFPSNPPVINSVGQTAFRGFLSGTGTSSHDESGIWSEGGGNGLALIARSGDAAPDTGGALFYGFGRPILNNAGQTAFSGSLGGTRESFHQISTISGIWSEGGGNGLSLVALEGDVAPGTGGAAFSFFSSSSPFSRYRGGVLNEAGQTAFMATLTGLGVNDDNSTGIWAEAPSGLLKLIARIGDLFDVDDGPGTDLRTIRYLSFVGDTGNGDGRPSGFNNLGQLAFMAGFTDGTSGVFVSNLAAIPEPATWVLGAFALFGLFVRPR